MWEYPANALKPGEYTPLRSVEWPQVRVGLLDTFTEKAAAAFGRKNETSPELFVLCVERGGATDAEWKAKRAQGIPDGFECACS